MLQSGSKVVVVGMVVVVAADDFVSVVEDSIIVGVVVFTLEIGGARVV